jgi:hypothetical protein
MKARDDFQLLLEKINDEDSKGPIDNIPVVLEGVPEQRISSEEKARASGFRPLTEEEKEEFVNSLDANGKKILAEFANKKKQPK